MNMTGLSKEERLKAFMAGLDDDEPPLHASRMTAMSDQPSAAATPVDAAVPFFADTDALEEEDPSDGDVIEAMQQLLLAHEQTDLHRVEDPELERVLNELRAVAHSNIADVFESQVVREYVGVDEDDKEVWQSVNRMLVKDITTIPRAISACIQTVKVTHKPGGDVIEVKMYDKLVSIDKLMRFYGAYQRDNEQQAKGTEGVMDLLLASIGSQGLPVIEDNRA